MLSYHTIVIPHDQTIVMPCDHTIVVPHDHTIVMPCDHTIVIPYEHTIVMPCGHTIVIPYDHTIVIPHYYHPFQEPHWRYLPYTRPMAYVREYAHKI